MRTAVIPEPEHAVHASGPTGGAAPEADPLMHRPAVSLRLLVPLLAIGLLTCAMIGAATIAERNARAIVMRELQTRLVLEARMLALASERAFLGEFPELTLQPIVREMASKRPELAHVVVIDHQNIVHGHPDVRALGKPYESLTGLEPVTSAIPLDPGEMLYQNRELILAHATVRLASGRRIGTAIVGMRRSYVESALSAGREKQALFFAVLLVIAVLSTFTLMTLVLRPLGRVREGLERIGRGDLDTRIIVRDRTEIGVLARAINSMASRLKTAQREMLDKERLAREVELARDIQLALLPRGASAFGPYVIEGAHRAAAEVGGDYYDVVTLPNGRVGLAIADVSGKGLGGCLITTMLSALVHALRTAHPSPSGLMVTLEKNLVSSLPRGGFVTMLYAILDPATDRMVFASAGHTPMLIYRAATGAVETRRSRSVPIGAIRAGALARMLHDETLELGPGDLVVHFTDGYSEAIHHASGEQFGVKRIAEIVRTAAPGGSRSMIDALTGAIADWARMDTPLDDETLLVIGRSSVSGTAYSTVDHSAATSSESPEAWLERAEARGHRLTLAADFAELTGIRSWIDRCPGLGDLDQRRSRLLESALYEMCANIVEHGYGKDRACRFDLWWVVDERAGHSRAGESLRGYFLLRDHGVPFRPQQQRQFADLSDPQVRRKGRGLGLEMVHRIMEVVAYHPGTAHGNLTLLVFDSDSETPAKEAVNE